MSRILCMIPARIGSTRLPGKPLLDVNGVPLIVMVYRNAISSKAFDDVFVATDDSRIAKTITDSGGTAIMTSDKHRSGTDRIFEAVSGLACTHIVNLQGDEPAIPGDLLRLFAAALIHIDDNSLLTVVSHATIEDKSNPNVVKAVLDKDKRALYFSRAAIPFERSPQAPAYKHAGIYGFTLRSIERFCGFPPGELEQTERLEQLRALENGMNIHCMLYDFDSVGIDTREDLDRFRLLSARSGYER